MCETSRRTRVQAQWRYRSVEISKRVEILNLSRLSTVNREYFVIKIFSDTLTFAKIKRTKMHAQY